MNRRHLIVNADDYGLCDSVNQAVERLFESGALSSTCVLAPARLAEHACKTAALRGFGAGVHWTLNSELPDEPYPPCAPAAGTLLDAAGYLPLPGEPTPLRATGAHVLLELEAQIQRMRALGCAPDHADSHGGTLYGMNGRLFFIAAFRACRRHALPFRFAKSSAFIRRQMGALPPPIAAAHRAIVGLARAMGVQLLDDMVTNPFPAARIGGYDALKRYYEDQLRRSPAGVTELVLHPALPDPAQRARTGEWQKREWEYQYLDSGELDAFLRREGFTKVDWRFLRPKSTESSAQT